MMGRNSSTNVAKMEDGIRSRPEQLCVGEGSQTRESRRRNYLVLGVGIALGLVIMACTVLAVLWALKRHEQPISRIGNLNLMVNPPEPQVCLSSHCVLAAASLLKNMDQSAEPCTDFYQYACGNWAKSNPLPDDKSSYDTFNKLRDDLQLVLKELLSEPVVPEDSNATANAKILYASCMNETLINSRAEDPLLNLLEELGGWPVIHSWWNESAYNGSELLGKLKQYNNDILITQWVGADPQNSTMRIIQIDQPELGLPSREYYLHKEEKKVLDAYFNYMLEAAELLGADQDVAQTDMKNVLEFEINLARILEPAEQRRNFSQLHSKLTIAELEEIVPEINWLSYFEAFITTPFNETEEVAVFSMTFMKRLNTLLENSSKRVVTNYVLWRFVNHRVNNLDRRFAQKKQNFFQVLYGRQREPERWKTCTVYVNTVMGMAVGSMFVKRHFNEESKHNAEDMIHTIQEAFVEILQGLDWMETETKTFAIEKAMMISKRIGYPEYILDPDELDKDNEGLHFELDKYFENVLMNLRHLSKGEQDLLRLPVNKTLWSTAPVVVNAFYSRSKNQILFPAGILQPPFYHSSYPKSLNYGGIGVVIGHEITHGFDDRGRQFDKDGNLKLWWSDTAIEKFHKKAQCIVEQYSNYTVPSVGMKINGVVTQGENIADNGGIKQAYRAYQRWVSQNGEESLLPGLNLTHNQLFFVNFAQVWCTVMTPEAAVSKIRQGPHSPGQFRIIGTLSNSEEFSEAYSCPLGSAMNPRLKCSLW